MKQSTPKRNLKTIIKKTVENSDAWHNNKQRMDNWLFLNLHLVLVVKDYQDQMRFPVLFPSI